ncbi:coxsackievirus and adenovirus receptor homolog isoform X3 [Poecilia latipinna]|uniref:coxsackievirus and adenovirus receptor homolog isoform X2 n=1 Tax=Poecilia latipinna TaxID=48699 RepID=UPI00072E064E|nr:PREDICTED: coxsackievirus and adenovirus receptor homolog isoform X2 [Poecilia latipinna]XP_014881144.1 PREDICTED: coxsackievirus and adenovirus receptor homolog isoform X3 [Poecilia latipinna]
MASSSQLLLLWLLLLNVSSVSTDSNQHSITAESGQNIILPCQVSDRSPVLVVEWKKAELGSCCVLLFRDSQFDSEHQHPSFKDRVDLQDKNGDASLVLRHLTTDDSGTYECRVFLTGAKRNLVAEPNIIINLTVTPESRMVSSRGSRAGSSGLVIGLAVLLLLLLFTD